MTDILRFVTDYLAQTTNLEDEINELSETMTKEDSSNTEVPEGVKRSAASMSLSDFDNALDPTETIEQLKAERFARGNIQGYPVTLKLTFKQDSESTKFIVRLTIERPIEKHEKTDKVLKSLKRKDEEHIKDPIRAYKTFEDTVEEYDLDEITDPDMPEKMQMDKEGEEWWD